MDKKYKKVPDSALRFKQSGKKSIQIGLKNQIKLVAYSGNIIKGHWYWGDLAIDLQGMSFPLSRFPILENHDPNKKIGFSGIPSIENRQLVVNGTLLTTEHAERFKRLSREGFPYQSSIYAKPIEVEKLTNNESRIVNGIPVKGPATIWNKSEFKEASICVFGWDPQTKASALSQKHEHLTTDQENEIIANELLSLAYGQQQQSKETDNYDDNDKIVADLVRLTGR